MNKIEIKNWKTGKVIFSYECENNTIEKTLNIAKNLKYADLRYADLCNANLSSINLTHANFSNAKLNGVFIIGADLSYSIFDNVNMSNSNLYHAKLNKCILNNVNLYNSNLSDANLSHSKITNTKFTVSLMTNAKFNYTFIKRSNFYSCNLFGSYVNASNFENCNFERTTLTNINFCNCIFKQCNLSMSTLSYSNMSSSKFIETNIKYAILLNTILPDLKYNSIIGFNDECPKEGSFIGWKKCYDNNNNFYIVKLEILTNAKRGSGTSTKCRCDKAKVLDILNIITLKSESENINEVHSMYDPDFIYKIGNIIEVKDFDDDFKNTCSKGIHFFMNEKDAINYVY